jgi:hypothetical protein
MHRMSVRERSSVGCGELGHISPPYLLPSRPEQSLEGHYLRQLPISAPFPYEFPRICCHHQEQLAAGRPRLGKPGEGSGMNVSGRYYC